MLKSIRLVGKPLALTALSAALVLGVSACAIQTSKPDRAAPASPKTTKSTPAEPSSTVNQPPPKLPPAAVEPAPPVAPVSVPPAAPKTQPVAPPPPVAAASSKPDAAVQPSKPAAPVAAPKPAVAAPKPAAPAPVSKPAMAKPEVAKATAPTVAPIAAKPAPAAPSAFRVSGEVKMLDGSGKPLSGDELTELVVYFEPDAPVAAAPPIRSSISTQNKRFEPATLVVPVGSTISFPNLDVVLHNAFSVTPNADFDLGIYGGGEKREHVFSQPGVVRVHCNVHHSMQADVVVVSTPFFGKADAQGRFVFNNVPAGKGQLTLWHPRASLQSQTVSIPVAGPIVLTLVANKPSIAPHTRKDGGSYRDELGL